MTSLAEPDTISDLVQRSNRLGSDATITNYAGGNASAKVALPDPIAGDHVAVLVVKGSGGDLGTITADGFAYLRLDRLLALETLYDRGVHEDDLVPYYQQCAFGTAGAVPSIDTPLHALVDVAHIDHLHPDSVIALAAAADGEALVQRCFGDELGWLDWKRPGFELGLALREFHSSSPDAVGAVLGGHGLICWGDSSDQCEANSIRIIGQAAAFLAEHGDEEPFGSVAPGFTALSETARKAEAAALAPVVRGIASADAPKVGCFNDSPEVLDFLARAEASRLVELGTSCPDHFLRSKVKPLFLDQPVTAPFDARVERLHELHGAYRDSYCAYYEAHATPESPAMRGADPAVVLVPGVGMWSFGADPQTARVAGEYYVNAINVMRGAEAISRYSPMSDADRFAVEYWELEERKLRMRPPAPVLCGRVAIVAGGASGIGAATARRLSASGACVVVADIDREGAEKVAADLPTGTGVAAQVDVSDETSVAELFATACLAFSGADIVVNSAGYARSASLTDTTVEEWDQLHAVLARGTFLLSRAAAGVMRAQGRGGDLIHVVSKNAVVAGPANIAYGAAKADQAHQVRLLAAELGSDGIRVNGVNPDGVVRGSGIFSGEWLQARADAYGVDPENLSGFYAGRTLLGAEVLPDHVAAAIHALVSGDLCRTTGAIIPVDGGLPEAFMR